ncbi:NUDIX hydrolase [Acetilactobacillus jinshanensis]|uniref:NUDIX hydrolase n=1 Tax=Acetilactobacillus jinshanensis TaxID=1720083 RepID=A0A4P6ZLB4_9LACO|nr:NUDIX hydrolase [Acetilactobacillus jinshanensis]QBP18353.1 NUDIX hydrolase [Acetilactobacillus jinshanensis]URL61219.1 NUDIX hydrolase [uncultured bacterium]
MSKALRPERAIKPGTIKTINSFMKLKHETVKIPYTNRLAGRDTILHAPDVAGVVIAKKDGKPQIILEKQWRQSVNEFTLETPAGKLDPRDADHPHHAFMREMNEELRVVPQTVKLLTPKALYGSPGCTDEATYFYYATDLKPVDKDLPRDLGEYMKLEYYTMPQALKLMTSGKVRDMKTNLAILYWLKIANEK